MNMSEMDWWGCVWTLGGVSDSDERNEVGEEGTETVDVLAGTAHQLNSCSYNSKLTNEGGGLLPNLQRPRMSSYPFHI